MNTLCSAPTRLVLAGGTDIDDLGRVFAALDAAHAGQHLSQIIVVAPEGRSNARSTVELARRWAARNGVAVQTWLFVPARVDLARWLAHECQADVILRMPGRDFGLIAAAQKVGLSVLAADGRTRVSRIRPKRRTLRFFPPWMRPGRALNAA